MNEKELHELLNPLRDALDFSKEDETLIENCVYCSEYTEVHSQACQGYMSYCNFLKRKINVYEDYKNCIKGGK